MKKAIKVNHKKKTVTISKQFNPPKFNAWVRNKVKTEYPDYEIIEKSNADS